MWTIQQLSVGKSKTILGAQTYAFETPQSRHMRIFSRMVTGLTPVKRAVLVLGQSDLAAGVAYVMS